MQLSDVEGIVARAEILLEHTPALLVVFGRGVVVVVAYDIIGREAHAVQALHILRVQGHVLMDEVPEAYSIDLLSGNGGRVFLQVPVEVGTAVQRMIGQLVASTAARTRLRVRRNEQCVSVRAGRNLLQREVRDIGIANLLTFGQFLIKDRDSALDRRLVAGWGADAYELYAVKVAVNPIDSVSARLYRLEAVCHHDSLKETEVIVRHLPRHGVFTGGFLFAGVRLCLRSAAPQ